MSSTAPTQKRTFGFFSGGRKQSAQDAAVEACIRDGNCSMPVFNEVAPFGEPDAYPLVSTTMSPGCGPGAVVQDSWALEPPAPPRRSRSPFAIFARKSAKSPVTLPKSPTLSKKLWSQSPVYEVPKSWAEYAALYSSVSSNLARSSGGTR